MLCGVSFLYDSIFSWGRHIFKIALFHLSNGPWKIFYFFPSAIFSFCFVLAATKDHGGEMVMSLALILLSLPILQGSGLQDNEAQTQTTVTSVLEVMLPVWLPAVAEGSHSFSQTSSFKWGLFTFLSEVLLECTVDIYQHGYIKKLQSLKSLCKFLFLLY